MSDLAGLGVDVDRPDRAADEFAERTGLPAGRLGELARWLAAAQGGGPADFRRARIVVVGAQSVPGRIAQLADAGVRSVDPMGGTDRIGAGATVADEEVDGGSDLLVVSVPDSDIAAMTLVSVLTNTEPVKVLPRGAVVTPADWMGQAIAVRDGRRAVFALRDDPDALLAAMQAAPLQVGAGLIMQAAARRTPVVLDGLGAVAAALAAHAAQPRAAQWWQVADRVAHPALDVALAKLGSRPLLDLGIDSADGTAGALAVLVLRAAAYVAAGA
jgi:NaMN:DMB phosphoribosyltransferase